MNHNPLKIRRPKRENKSKIINLRLTDSELDELNQLREEMQFSSTREFFLFGIDLIKQLREWHSMNYHFYIGLPDDRKSFREVEFELTPEFHSSNKKGVKNE